MQIAGPVGSEYRVVQFHPTLRCNLRCLHCYSTSAPELRDQLSLDVLQRAVLDLWQEGFNVLSVSGGEPLLFAELPALLRFARSLGLITSVTTNGMLLSHRNVEMLKECAQLVAVSLDGIPESHNHMRANPRAFEQMSQKVQRLREAKIPFGFIFTLTLYNLNELDWVARFAVEQGATLLQVHPLEEAGRAAAELVANAPDELELAYAFVEVARLQTLYQGRLTIQYDVADRDLLRTQPERAFVMDSADVEAQQLPETPLADLVSPLILEADGSLVPVQYGFSHAFRLCNVLDGSLRAHAALWKQTKYPAFLELCRGVYADLMSSDSPYPFVNWYAAICAASRAHVAAPLETARG